MKMINKLTGNWKIWKKRISATLACMVVFVTVYAMVLPAITLDQDAAYQEEGLVLEAENIESEPDHKETDLEESDFFEEEDSSLWEDNTEETAEDTWAMTDGPVTLQWPAEPEETEEAEEVIFYDESGEEIDYFVEATFGEDSGLPADVTLEVSEIKAGTKEYEAYHKSSLEAVKKEGGKETEISYARFFDITFLNADGDVIEPTGPVSIVIRYKDEKELNAEAAEDLSVLHFAQEDQEEQKDQKNLEELPQPELMDIETEIKDDQVESITFGSESFSVYGVVGTYSVEIDAEEGEGGEHVSFSHNSSLKGGDSIFLSELLEEAWPDREDLRVGNVVEVTAGEASSEDASADEAADGNILKVSFDKAAEDYKITADTELEEDLSGQKGNLTVHFNDGNTAVFRITISGTPAVDAGDGLAVISSADGSYLPETAEGSAEEMAEEDISDSAAETVSAGGSDTVSRVFDISLNLSQEEQEVYNGGFQVSLTLPEEVTGRDFHLYHIHDGKTEELDIQKTGSEPDEAGLETVSAVQFVTESFSEFVLQYTVDFKYSVNGKMYQFSLPGGGFVRFTELVEVLGITHDTNSEENGINEGAEENGINAYMNTAPTLSDAEVSEATKKFVADVASVEFSSPELVDVSRVENETTVGQIKEIRGLECEYSAELTEEQIADINAQTVKAGDWALISVQPFMSEETLTVTMKDGEVFTIHVTDAQIKKTVIDAKGDTWEITVTYDDSAEIPDEAKLKVEEILPEEENFENYLQDSAVKVSLSIESIDYARFFDIVIQDEQGNKIEPKSAVSVDMVMLDSYSESIHELCVVHFENDVPVIMDTEYQMEDGKKTMSFQTDSFSTYGVITSPAPSVENMDGVTFTMSRNGSYVTANVENNRLTQSNSSNDAATWQFESAGNGQYNIFTMDNGSKRYINIANAGNNGNVSLSGTAQAFTIEKNSNGTYSVKTQAGNRTYYLNHYSGNNGFAGWHTKSSPNDEFNFNFSQPALTADDAYMVLVKIGEKYYIVLNNGELEETENPVDGNGNMVGAETPMLWTYNGSDLYHPAEAVAYSGRNVASDYYYRYIDPRSNDGLSIDTASTVTTHDLGSTWYGWMGLHVDSRDLMTDAQITYDDENHTITSVKDPSKVLKVVEEDGKYKIAGGNSDGEIAEVYLAKFVNKDYLHIGERYHAVDHIDISVEAATAVNMPLAYGTYYYVEGGEVKTLVVTRENHVTLNLSQDKVPITKEDIKEATITAYKKGENGEQINVPDAFTITGYSSNNENGSSTDQVRIAGAFKVADLPAQPNSVNGNDYWRQQRLNNRIYYSVATTKEIPFNMVYNGHQLYSSATAAEASMQPGYNVSNDENALTVTSTVTLAASFDYWDSRNECPGIYALGHTSDWAKGDIFCAEDDAPDNGNSGMDFALGSATSGDTSVTAIEITKYLVDSDENLITPDRELEHVFHVYRKGIDKNADPNPIDEVKNMDVDDYNGDDPSYDNYTHLHDKTVTVGDGGMGIVYDYDVSAGMIYVEEDTDEENLWRLITDVNGKEWFYKETRLETEYVWRNDGIEDRRHVSKAFTSEEEAYRSIPDVLGAYRDIDGIDQYNGFLEFYVYNVYDTEPTDISVEKVWKHKNGSVATAPDGARVTVTLGRYKLAEDPDNPVSGSISINQTITNLPDDKDFQATYKIKRNGITVKSVGYDPEIGGALISGLPAGDYTVEISSSVDDCDVTNTPSTQNVTVVAGQTKNADFVSNVKEKEVTKTIAVRVTNSISGTGNENYQDATYIFPAGSKIAVNYSRPGSGHNGNFHMTITVNGVSQYYENPTAPVNGNAYAGITETKVFQLPSDDNYTESNPYTINIWHDWGKENLWINSVSIYSDNSANSTNSVGRRLMSMRTPILKGEQNDATETPETISQDASADYTNRSKIPDSPISGMIYVVDENWSTEEEPYTVELSGTTWRRVVEELEKEDKKGNKYIYFIKSVHEEGVPAGTTLTIDMKDGKILTSLSDVTLTVTNRVPNEPPTVTIRKVDENGFPMTGVKFSVSKDGGEAEEFEITNADGTYALEALQAGSYVINETAWPAGYAQMPGSITFTVTADYDLTCGNTPADVTFDGETFTYKVINQPLTEPGSLSVRKQWLDFYGNTTNYDGTIDLTLVQWVPGDPVSHTVNFVIKCEGDGNGNQSGNTTTIATRRESGIGDASIHWDWDQWTDDHPFEVAGLEGSTYDSVQTSGGNNNKGGRTVTIHNITKDQTVEILIKNEGYKGTADNLIGQPAFNGNNPDMGPLVPTGGTKTVTLGTDGVWTQIFNVSGEGILSNESQTLPVTNNGKTCYYTISEESIPGYTLERISTNPINVGVLTAYNKKNSLDLNVVKVDTNNLSTRLNGAEFVLRQLDPTKTGSMDTRTLEGTQSITKITAGEGAEKGRLVFDNLQPGYYELKETVAPAGYILLNDGTVYFRVSETGMHLLQADTETAAENWRTIPQTSGTTFHNGTMTVGNTPGAALPSTGGPGTRLFTILGSILILGAGVLLWRRRRLI